MAEIYSFVCVYINFLPLCVVVFIVSGRKQCQEVTTACDTNMKCMYFCSIDTTLEMFALRSCQLLFTLLCQT